MVSLKEISFDSGNAGQIVVDCKFFENTYFYSLIWIIFTVGLSRFQGEATATPKLSPSRYIIKIKLFSVAFKDHSCKHESPPFSAVAKRAKDHLHDTHSLTFLVLRGTSVHLAQSVAPNVYLKDPKIAKSIETEVF